MDEKTKKNKLREIFSNDDLGLLDSDEDKNIIGRKEKSQLVESFTEIIDFYNEHGRTPKKDGNIKEFQLACRLENIKKDSAAIQNLLPYDCYNILDVGGENINTINEIFNSDPLGLLETDEESDSIYVLSHVKPSDRLRPDYIAHRKMCRDFYLYEEGFQKIQEDLENGKRHLVEYKGGDLTEGKYYVLRGVKLYLEKNVATEKNINYKSGSRKRVEGRTRCIFDNGTESTMLYRSLGKALAIDGFSISDVVEDVSEDVEISENDEQNGYIYVVRSLNQTPEIHDIPNLYKIGYCSGDVTTRLKNAINEPTYLMSDVEIVLTVRCFNLDVPYLEGCIHDFFKDANVCFEVIDNQGITHFPKEWFAVPLNIIEDAIQLIVDKKIENYRYDNNMELIVEK